MPNFTIWSPDSPPLLYNFNRSFLLYWFLQHSEALSVPPSPRLPHASWWGSEHDLLWIVSRNCGRMTQNFPGQKSLGVRMCRLACRVPQCNPSRGLAWSPWAPIGRQTQLWSCAIQRCVPPAQGRQRWPPPHGAPSHLGTLGGSDPCWVWSNTPHGRYDWWGSSRRHWQKKRVRVHGPWLHPGPSRICQDV